MTLTAQHIREANRLLDQLRKLDAELVDLQESQFTIAYVGQGPSSSPLAHFILPDCLTEATDALRRALIAVYCERRSVVRAALTDLGVAWMTEDNPDTYEGC